MGSVLEPIEEARNAAVELPLHLYQRVYMRERGISDKVRKQVADLIALQTYSRVIWNLKERVKA